jgi:hypothetical protein
MRALTVVPGKPGSLILENVEPPPASDGAVLVRMLTLAMARLTGCAGLVLTQMPASLHCSVLPSMAAG